MAVQNLIESRIENPKIRIYSEEDKKFYANGLSKHNAQESQYEESLHR